MKKFLKLKLIFVFVVVAMLSAVAGVLGVPSSARASTTITVRGAVSCASHALMGVWVQSSGGGSRFASWNASPGDSWDGVYWTTITASDPTTTISLHVGCGGSSGNWGSDNWTPGQTITGDTDLMATCNEGNMSPHTATRCSYGQTNAESTAIWWATPYIGTNKYPDQCLTFVFDMYKL